MAKKSQRTKHKKIKGDTQINDSKSIHNLPKNKSSTQSKNIDDEPKYNKLIIHRKKIVAIVTFLAAVAGIWAVSGYTLRDFFERPKPLKLHVGQISLETNEKCDVVFMLQHTNDNYPRVVAIPLFIENPMNRTIKSVQVLIKVKSPLLKVLQGDSIKAEKLGLYTGVNRVASKSGDISSSGWTIKNINRQKKALIVEQLMWLQDVKKVDKSLTLKITIDAEDIPPTSHELTLWTALQSGEITAFGKEVSNAEKSLLVWFTNYKLLRAKKGFNTPFYGVQSSEDIHYRKLN